MIDFYKLKIFRQMDKFLSEAALLGFPKNKSQANAVPEKFVYVELILNIIRIKTFSAVLDRIHLLIMI